MPCLSSTKETLHTINNATKDTLILFLPRKRGFKLAFLNITSRPKHIDELRILFADKSIDVLSINETMLGETINDQDVFISGYDIIRRDRNRNSGRVCFYIRSTISYSLRLTCSSTNSKIYTLRSENLTLSHL